MKAFPIYSNSKKNRYIMSKELLGQHFKMIQPANIQKPVFSDQN